MNREANFQTKSYEGVTKLANDTDLLATCPIIGRHHRASVLPGVPWQGEEGGGGGGGVQEGGVAAGGGRREGGVLVQRNRLHLPFVQFCTTTHLHFLTFYFPVIITLISKLKDCLQPLLPNL